MEVEKYSMPIYENGVKTEWTKKSFSFSEAVVSMFGNCKNRKYEF